MAIEESQGIVPTTVLTLPTPQNLEAFRMGLRFEYEYEITEAEADFDTAKKRGGHHLAQLTRAFNRLERAKMKLAALDQGYLPVPRMPVERMSQWRLDQLETPEAVQERLNQALESGVFERIALIVPDNTQRARRDPLIIGIIGPNTNSEEHFLIAWWR